MANSSNLAFCLEYSNHKTDMLDAFDDYLRSESMVDVMLSCEGHTIKAHKMVLSAGSTYFRNIFSAFKNPFQFPVLIIKDMPFRDMKAIVEFLYRGEVVVPVEQVSSLSKSAQTLFIKGLEKYFNKSAVVDVGSHSNQSNAGNTTAVGTSSSTSAKTTVKSLKTKNTTTGTTGPKLSTGMSLRQKRRPNYRQLSNGDFNSDESNSEFEEHPNPVLPKPDMIRVGRGSTQVTYGRRNQSSLSRRIKSEGLYNNEDYMSDEREATEMPLLEAQSALQTDSQQMTGNSDEEVNEDNETDDAYQSDNQSNRYSAFNYIEAQVEGKERQASTSRFNCSDEVQVEPRGLIKNAVRITPRRVKTPFMGRQRRRKDAKNRANTQSANTRTGVTTSHSSDVIVGPIKGDPDKVQIIHCSLCPRVFSQTSSLNIHMKRIHADDRKEHICQLCGKKYSWRSGLYKHMRTHR